MIVYLARAIQAFVMYCVKGTSCSSLLIESTDSMISKVNIHKHQNPKGDFRPIYFSGRALYLAHLDSHTCTVCICILTYMSCILHIYVPVHTCMYSMYLYTEHICTVCICVLYIYVQYVHVYVQYVHVYVQYVHVYCTYMYSMCLYTVTVYCTYMMQSNSVTPLPMMVGI